MHQYNQTPARVVQIEDRTIAMFEIRDNENIDTITVKSFGDEWNQFDRFNISEIESAANEYFDIVPQNLLNEKTHVLDLGCGSGRWSLFLADRVGSIESIDPSNSVFGASKLLSEKKNVRVSQASVSNIPFEDGTFDFLLCLGVLHHIPNTEEALNSAAKKIKSGGHALLYFYYNLDNRNYLYKIIFGFTDLFRRMISKLPGRLKRISCDLIAVFIYLPMIAFSRFIKSILPKSNASQKIPLSYYINKPWKIIRNDALDRFGTPLEQRFSKKEIAEMLAKAGFGHVEFSNNMPYWHCLAKKV
jgi:ubiquinone/menaquinone biosynthesis C-methylase UbiE